MQLPKNILEIGKEEKSHCQLLKDPVWEFVLASKRSIFFVLSSGVQSYPGNALGVLLPSAVGRVQADFIHNNDL